MEGQWIIKIPVENFAIQDPSSENPCWVDFGELGIELDSLRELIPARRIDFEASPICRASDAECVKILVGSVFGGMEIDLVLVGMAIHD